MLIEVTEHDGMTVLTIDDGGNNVMSMDLIAELSATIDGLDGAPFVLIGNDKALSAGLDRKLFTAGREAIIDLLLSFGELTRKVWLHPAPVVVAVTGHAIAGGTFLAMSADWAVAVDGPYVWGMTEVSFGMTLPSTAIVQARYRMRNDVVDRLALGGVSLGPQQALAAGMLDAIHEREDLLAAAVAKANALAAFPRRSYAETKRRLRGHLAEVTPDQARADLDEWYDHSPVFELLGG